MLPLLLPDGTMLVVGRDLRDRLEIESLVWRALAIGGLCALLLAILGALLFRRQLQARIAAIRHTAREIEAGDLSRRIPVSSTNDEFARLGHDINQMLDWIEHLMDGVRHVSNAIAHDLRTPLGRIRGQLEEALRPGQRGAQLTTTAGSVIKQIDELIGVFDRLLQIAEAESGTRRQSFAPVQLEAVIADIVELYDAEAEERGITLIAEMEGATATLGDKALLASAVANLIDNALKYAGDGGRVLVQTLREPDSVSIVVEDNGSGIPTTERARVVERFYRIDSSRSVPGNGLGLAIVSAIASLNWGSLQLEDAAPGLRARLVLPRIEIAAPTSEQMPKKVAAESF
jgi:signal transduction histidine kinase